jgi:hypothetical protein
MDSITNLEENTWDETDNLKVKLEEIITKINEVVTWINAQD